MLLEIYSKKYTFLVTDIYSYYICNIKTKGKEMDNVHSNAKCKNITKN